MPRVAKPRTGVRCSLRRRRYTTQGGWPRVAVVTKFDGIAVGTIKMIRSGIQAKSTLRPIRILLMLVPILATGCGQTYFPDALPISQEKVNEIRNSTTLKPQEMRDLLAAYDIDEVTINGLLSTVRLANQFGGNLESAYNKVVGGRMAEMTPDEVQYYGDATEETTFSDKEALAIVKLFKDNDIDTIAELTTYLDDNADQLPDDVDEDNLRNVFIKTSTDDVLDKI